MSATAAAASVARTSCRALCATTRHVIASLSLSLSINVVSEASLNFVTESGEFQNSGRVHDLSELTADYDINSFSVAPLSL